MKNKTSLCSMVLLFAFLLVSLNACQPATPQPTPTALPTPTITPTPGPQEMDTQTLLENCEALDQQKATVILTGKVFLPKETIYGYKGWYGMDLITDKRIAVLFQVGSGTNTMNDLPHYFFEQDLIIRDSAGRLVRHGHKVRVTGRPIFRADSETRRCEMYVDQVESLMPADVLQPKELTIEELTNINNIDECPDLEFTRQMVRLHGELRVDKDSSLCMLGNCTVNFTDKTGKGTARILEGDSPNHMVTLPDPFSMADLKVMDKNGELVDNTRVNLVGVVRETSTEQGKSMCEIIVYEIEKGAQ